MTGSGWSYSGQNVELQHPAWGLDVTFPHKAKTVNKSQDCQNLINFVRINEIRLDYLTFDFNIVLKQK